MILSNLEPYPIYKAEEFKPNFENYIVHVASFKDAKRHEILLKSYAKTKKSLPLLLLGKDKLLNDAKKIDQ